MGLLDVLIPVAIALGALAAVQVSPIVTVALGALVLLFANPFFTVVDYRLTEAAVEVTVCRAIRLRRVPYADILDVRRVRWCELVKPEVRWAQSLGSNIFRPLVLVRRGGGRRPVIITPGETDAFVAALRARLAPGGSPQGSASGFRT